MNLNDYKIYELVKLTQSLYAITLHDDAISWSANLYKSMTKVIIGHSNGISRRTINDGNITDSFTIPFHAHILSIVGDGKIIGAPPHKCVPERYINSSDSYRFFEQDLSHESGTATQVLHTLLASNGLKISDRFSKVNHDIDKLPIKILLIKKLF
jgi:hypothetical protein